MSIALLERPVLNDLLECDTGIALAMTRDASFMAALQNRCVEEIAGRIASGHRPYVAYVDDQPAAWGWVATRTATIGELQTTFTLPERERYLWNFVTLPAFRGRGIYPRLLTGIIQSELADTDLFWIAYAPENRASASGIHRAGFKTVATLSFDEHRRPAISVVDAAGAMRAAQLLDLPVADAVSQCWRCVRNGHTGSTCSGRTCKCDYQRPQIAC